MTMSPMTMSPILEVKNLKTSFFTSQGEIKAVDDVSFEVYKGKTLAIVGESGCGKSVTSLSIMRLIAEPPGKIVGGQILFESKDLTRATQEELRKIRGNRISMIFQEPMTSLNPVFTIGNQIEEAILLHQKVNKVEARKIAIEMLKLVGIPAPEKRVFDYPHQLSGGMRQRVMIAMALSCNPDILIADEPTTALDVTIQAQILELLKDLQKRLGMALVLITHDLGVVAETADEVIVMYAGHIVEKAPVQQLFKNPKHPYTRGLLNSIPKPGSKRLETIAGMVPHLLKLPKGCRFADRCAHVSDECRAQDPSIREVGPQHLVRCVKSGVSL